MSNEHLTNSPIVVVTAIDENYVLPLSVMIKSLEINFQACRKVNICVLFNKISGKAKSEIQNSIQSNNIIIQWKHVNADLLKGLKVSGHISIHTYFRLLIEELFPEYDKVIYLDADLILNQCISKLWEFYIEDTHLLAVPMASKKSGIFCGERGIPSYKLLGIPGDTRTFNAGVMIMNLKLWRRDGVSRNVMKYLKEYEDYVLWWDQDGLNVLLHNKWKAIPAKWNVITSHLTSFNDWRDSLLSREEFEEINNSPGIVHFAGPDKPWKFNYNGVFKEAFTKYFNLLSSEYLKTLDAENATYE